MAESMDDPTSTNTKTADLVAVEAKISEAAPNDAPNGNGREGSDAPIALPSSVAGSGTLDRLVDTPRDYAKASTAENTSKAYGADWEHFSRWCRLRGADPLPPSAELIGLYLTALAAPTDGSRHLAATTIERRLSGLVWNYKERGMPLDRGDHHIAKALANAYRTHSPPPSRKEVIHPDEILAMAATLPADLRGLRDRAILLIGFAGGLGRNQIVSLDLHPRDTRTSAGWVEIEKPGAVLTLATSTGWRDVEIGRGSARRTCPVHALEQWLHFAGIERGPVFVRTSRDGQQALDTRLSDKHVVRLIKATVLRSGIRADLPETERLALFAGQSLRAGLGRAAQTTLGQGSADPTGRTVRFRVNLTRAMGL